MNFSIFQDLLDKKTPVILASEENRWELVKFLFSKGADLNIGTRSNKKPIHYACLSNNIGMVKWLFEHGAEPNQRLNNGSNEKNMTADVDVSDFSLTVVILYCDCCDQSVRDFCKALKTNECYCNWVCN